MVPAALLVAALGVWLWRSAGDAADATGDGGAAGERGADRARPRVPATRAPALAGAGAADDHAVAPTDAAAAGDPPDDRPPGSFHAATDHTADPCTAQREA